MSKTNLRRGVGNFHPVSDNNQRDLGTARDAAKTDRQRSEGGLFGMFQEFSGDAVLHLKKDSPQYKQIAALAKSLRVLDESTRNYVLALPSTQEAVSDFVTETRGVASEKKVQQGADHMFNVVNIAIAQYEAQQVKTLRGIVGKEHISRGKIAEAGLQAPATSEAGARLRAFEGGEGEQAEEDLLPAGSLVDVSDEEPFTNLALVESNNAVLEDNSDRRVDEWLESHTDTGEIGIDLNEKTRENKVGRLESLLGERLKIELDLKKFVDENKRSNFLMRFVKGDKYSFFVTKFQEKIADKNAEIQNILSNTEGLVDILPLLTQEVYGSNNEISQQVAREWLDTAEADEMLAAIPAEDLVKASAFRPQVVEGTENRAGVSDADKMSGLEGVKAQIEQIRNDLAMTKSSFDTQMSIRKGLSWYELGKKNQVDEELDRLGNDIKNFTDTLVYFYNENPQLLENNEKAKLEFAALVREMKQKKSAENTKNLAKIAGFLALFSLVKLGIESTDMSQVRPEPNKTGATAPERSGGMSGMSLPGKKAESPKPASMTPFTRVAVNALPNAFTPSGVPAGFGRPDKMMPEGFGVVGGGGGQTHEKPSHKKGHRPVDLGVETFTATPEVVVLPAPEKGQPKVAANDYSKYTMESLLGQLPRKNSYLRTDNGDENSVRRSLFADGNGAISMLEQVAESPDMPNSKKKKLLAEAKRALDLIAESATIPKEKEWIAIAYGLHDRILADDNWNEQDLKIAANKNRVVSGSTVDNRSKNLEANVGDVQYKIDNLLSTLPNLDKKNDTTEELGTNDRLLYASGGAVEAVQKAGMVENVENSKDYEKKLGTIMKIQSKANSVIASGEADDSQREVAKTVLDISNLLMQRLSLFADRNN